MKTRVNVITIEDRIDIYYKLTLNLFIISIINTQNNKVNDIHKILAIVDTNFVLFLKYTKKFEHCM